MLKKNAKPQTYASVKEYFAGIVVLILALGGTLSFFAKPETAEQA